MAQLVGNTCVRCDQRIAFANDATFCDACGAPVHTACAAPDPGTPGSCRACGAAEPPAKQLELASLKRVRAVGACMTGAGLIWIVLAPASWTVRGQPAWVFGTILAVYGLWPLLFPRSTFWRKRVARIDEERRVSEGWERPGERGTADVPASPDRVEGTFDTPAFSMDYRQFPVTGDGTMAFSPAGIGISAFSSSSVLRNIGLRTAFILIVAGVLLAAIFSRSEWLILAAVGAVLAAALKSVLAGWIGQGKPLTLTIPWACVHGFQPLRDGRVRILVKDMKPSGAIHFRPPDVEPVLAALERGGRP